MLIVRQQTNKMLIIVILFSIILTAYSGISFALSPRDAYLSAESYYKALLSNTVKQKYKDNWLFCIAKYQEVYKLAPNGPWAAAGMYMSGKLYMGLYKISKAMSDKNRAIDIFKRVRNRYPKSQYSKFAQKELQKKTSSVKVIKQKFKKKTGTIKPTVKKTVQTTIKTNSTTSKIKPVVNNQQPIFAPVSNIVEQKSIIKNGSSPDKNVTNIRYWTNPSYTRIVINVDKKAQYKSHLLKRDPSLKKPQRLYIDFYDCRLQSGNKQHISINDNLLRSIRSAQYTKNTVRVVIDIKSFKDYKIFSLNNPFRVVIDIRGKASKITKTSNKIIKGNSTTVNKITKQHQVKTPPISKASAGALAKQLSLGVKRIVIDAGHGGKDVGATGYLKGVYEKDIALDIAKRLALKLRKKLKCEVLLTRNTDKFLTLEERTAFANTRNADLFISIHTNAARSRNARGIETYFLNLASDKTSISVAARENATSTKNISDLQSILNDLMRNAKINESSRLAGYVQDLMCKGVQKKYGKVKNKGVKQAPFYVLLGAQMPAILIETSFISNPEECKRLTSSRYKNVLCDSIVDGIEEYIRDTNMGL